MGPERAARRGGILLRVTETMPSSMQPLGAFQFAETPVECAEGKMAGFFRDLQHQTVREADIRCFAILIQRGSNDLPVLKCQLLMRQQHLDGLCDLGAGKVVRGGKNPGRLGEHDIGSNSQAWPASRDSRLFDSALSLPRAARSAR